MLTLMIFAGLIGLMAIGVPVAISLALVAIVTMLATGGVDLLIMLPQRMYSATTSFPLLAIPFFILAGNLMNMGGMTQRIFEVAQLIIGRIRGGLGHVNVVSSMIFAGMSGSAVADAVAIGTVEIPAMVKAGYTRRFSAAITAVSSTIGPIIPPSIPFVIYGSLANVSVGALFLAGIVPGLIMGIALMLAVALLARRKDLPYSPERPPLGPSLRILAEASPAIALPVIIVGGILFGFFTPTEAAVIASAYAMILGVAVYREFSLRDLPEVLWRTGLETAQVFFIIAAAGALGWVMVQQQVPNQIIEQLLAISASPWILLLIINIVLLVLGCFMEAIAIMLIVTPIFLPLLAKIGVDPIHFGVVIVLNLMIGLLTPPVGLCLYAISSIAKVPVSELALECLPYLLALLAVLAVVTFVPEISLFMPRLLGFGS